jgi:hypothetical protein
MMFTEEQLLKINKGQNAGDCKYYINALNKVLPLSLRMC